MNKVYINNNNTSTIYNKKIPILHPFFSFPCISNRITFCSVKLKADSILLFCYDFIRYLVGTEDGYILRCSTAYSDTYLDVYRAHGLIFHLFLNKYVNK